MRGIAGTVSTTGVADQWALRKIGWPAAFRSAKAKRDVRIAILDTGVDGPQFGLTGKLGGGFSAFEGSSPLRDPNGHGTWMTSIALAADPSARVMPVQVLNASGYGTDSDIIKGLVWAADHHANVVLMSFAGAGYSPELQRAIDYAWSKGAVVVAATGNAGSPTPTYPAGDAKVVGVAATDQLDHLWSKSNYGEDTFLVAPGVDVLANAVGGGTTSVNGTSASAALVAGGAALLLGADPKATNSIAVGRLARNADALESPKQTGNGRLNLARALKDTRTDRAGSGRRRRPRGRRPVRRAVHRGGVDGDLRRVDRDKQLKQRRPTRWRSRSIAGRAGQQHAHRRRGRRNDTTTGTWSAIDTGGNTYTAGHQPGDPRTRRRSSARRSQPP